ncbi:MAG TPA: acyl-CoA reductase [Micromonosporaceae bacterium]|nr:acyl-CoA reductase [Micromonosporaceae bacterium]
MTAPTGVPVAVPLLDGAFVRRILDQDRHILAGVPLQEIVSFLDRVGRLWKSQEFARRRIYVRQLQQLAGLSAKMAETEADIIGVVLTSHARMYDIIAADLGSARVLDDWVPREECHVRALPRGLAVHLLSGNVPIASVMSIVRGLVTKNLCVVKPATGDLVTPVNLALSFLEVDEAHPVTRALTVAYWPQGHPGGELVTRSADAVCVWGGAGAVSWARGAARPDAGFVAFGPKRSVALVGPGADTGLVASALAHDICHYDQRGCFSVQQVFVDRASVGRLVERLEQALDEYARILPTGRWSIDDVGSVTLARSEERFLGAEVRSAEGLDWTVVVCPPEPIWFHPLGRTVYVHPVESLSECYGFIGPEVQTVAVAPWECSLAHRDALARLGVSRIVEVGLSNVFRPGGPHDGVYPLQQLVRFVAHESPASVYGKSLVARLDQTEIIRGGRYTDLML